MKRPIFVLFAVLGMGTLMAYSNHAQSVSTAAPKRIVTPDTPLNNRLVSAVLRVDLAGVQSALHQGASADALLGWEGQTNRIPITMAALGSPDLRKDYLPIFRLLVTNVSAPNAADEESGRTMLMAAVDMNDVESVQRLLAKGADINAQAKRWPQGATALYNAIAESGRGDQEASPVILCLLEHGADTNLPDENGVTPLILAAQQGKVNVIRALLAHGADPALRDKRGWTAIRWTSGRGWDDATALLRDHSPMTLV
ncbi:hypothetical protein CCAX7_20510 [Capsulimonas corticalis]|uniref:Uncharacterized protein n=1 Tax=Capsulimonas corticalis TaxID=2219043 RepID=A0A402D2H9_9BACT|nr:ankyrin repeat domain-containing protein [Capsulimonas corticalis]BDI30000.1 hypothetical protein CCAX7_20510 [Capsulimonas corticalis]